MQLHPQKILLLDDDEATNFLHQRIIKRINTSASISVFEDGKEALSYLKEKENESPDLILLDVNMPGMDGWEFLESFPFRHRSKSVILMLSTYINESKKQQLPKDLKLSFLSKPLSFKTLVQTLENYFPSISES